jgi:hypothetical protein
MKTQRLILFLIATLGWFALVAQLILIIMNRKVSVAETIVRYFSFFTILTNTSVAVSSSILLSRKKSKMHSFVEKPETITAVALYITVVGIVYNVILRFTWEPKGLQLVVDELLHTVIPVLFIVFWLRYDARRAIRWTNVFTWLLYPLLYCVYVLLRGSASGFYPYPFINVNELGLIQVMINCLILFCVFLFGGLLFIFIKRLQQKRSNVS